MFRFLFSLFISFSLLVSADAAHPTKSRKSAKREKIREMNLDERSSFLLRALEEENWEFVLIHSLALIEDFPFAPIYQDAFYFLGVAYFKMEDFDLANESISFYLADRSSSKYLKEALYLKFEIAEQFRLGKKKHMGGVKFLPQWLSAKEDAIKIYDEVINSLPNEDIAASALFSKGALLLEEKEYLESIEAYQNLIRKFARHRLVPQAYVEIIRVYWAQLKDRFADKKYLDLALVNLRKFKEDFPSDEQIKVAEMIFSDMEELYAAHLRKIGQFYERTLKNQAAILYYRKVATFFSHTESAQVSRARLEVLAPNKNYVQPVNEKEVALFEQEKELDIILSSP